ncbi:hypothetical protein [Actinoplanes sp. NPDC051494]|uniref:hypothetical protein n=1 Tax=Actinoplanes sp. NPDC051494 TaxID=3363907 RepID=UPI0037B8DDA9
MARRVHLHVGAPKTGSTYVQNVLWKNRDALKKAGILLPGSVAAHDQAMTDLRSVPWRDPASTWTWDRLAAEAAAWPGDVVITNEGLGGATAEQAERAVRSLAPAEVHVIVAGRDLWRTFPSVWQQGVRARNVGRLDDFLGAVEQGKNDAFWDHTTNRMLMRWGDLVPADRRHLITVPPAGTPHDVLWQRFARVIGIPEGVCVIAAPPANPSLGAAEIEVLRRVNAALGDRYPHRTPYQKVVQRHLVDAVLKRAPNRVRFGVGAGRAGWVLDLADRQIKELDGYPCRVEGDLSELRPATVDRHPSPDELDDGQILQAAIESIVGLLGQADALHQQAAAPRTFARLRSRAARGLRRDR